MALTRYALITLFVFAFFPTQADAQDDVLKRGEYLVHVMDCTGCHTPGILKGKPDMSRYLGGSEVGFQVPGHGVSYPANLTPDPETGIGNWSVEEIMRAVRQGKRPDGTRLSPPMPWPSYAHLTDEDARALATYLKSLPAVKHATPKHVDDAEAATSPYLRFEDPE